MQNPILLVILGTVFTCIIQSSAASTGVFVAFLATGVIHSIDQSFFLVMGANIGTCIDGIMASLTTNANGKRIALFHVITSVIGAVSFTIILVLIRTPINNIFNNLFPGKPQFSLVTYNLIYNRIYTLVLLLFIDPLVSLVTRMVKDKKDKLEELSYIDERFLKTPAVAIEQALRELYNMAILAKENLDRSFASLINEDMSESKKIAEVEYRIDFLTNKLTGFFIKISTVTKFAGDEKLIGGLHHVTNDSCGKFARYEVHKVYRYFHIFFIPTFKWNVRYIVKTSCCNTLYELDSLVGKEFEKNPATKIRMENLRTINNNRPFKYCSNCQTDVYSDFKYCPYCGREL